MVLIFQCQYVPKYNNILCSKLMYKWSLYFSTTVPEYKDMLYSIFIYKLSLYFAI